MFDGLLPAYISDFISNIPQYMAFKWVAITLVCISILALLSIEQRRMNRYYQRLASHASVNDAQAVEYIIRLLSLSSRNKLLFSISLLILTFSLIFYDIKQGVSESGMASSCIETAQAAEPLSLTQEKLASEAKTTPPPSPSTSAPSVSRTALRQQYVNWVSSYYILKNCNRASKTMLANIEEHIAKSAGAFDKGSFIKSIKSEAESESKNTRKDIPCEHPIMNSLATQMQHLIELQR